MRDPAELKAAVAAIRKVGRCAFDTETTSLDTLEAKLVGLCLCWSPEDAIYVPVGHTQDGVRVIYNPRYELIP
mgnify:CR=1 FL=1